MSPKRLWWILLIAFLLGACQQKGSQTNPITENNIVEASPTLEVSVNPTATPLPTQTPTPLPTFGSTLSVVFVPDQQTVAVLEQPNEAARVVAYLEANQTDISTTGKFQYEGGRLWAEIQIPQGGTGWVDTQYLTTTYPADQFCSNSQVGGLAFRILEAFQQKDGDQLTKMVSPIHGLRVRTQWSNPEVYLGSYQEVQQLFSDTKAYLFGVDRRTQMPIEGSFMEIVYPMLLDTLDGSQEMCNTLSQGIAADWVSGFIQWPFEYANLNYLAVFRPAPPGDDLNWRMWAFGIEFLNQSPYLTVMVHYQWDF